MRYLLILMLLMSGCVSVHKSVYVHGKDKVTINMNSGTSVETAIDAALKAALK